MTDQAKAIAVGFIEAEDRSRSVDRSLCADGFKAHIAGFPEMDYDGFNAFATGLYGAFRDAKHIVEDVLSEDDRVALRVRLTGTHTGTFAGNPASGRPINVGSIAIFTIRSGKVADLSVELDQVGLLQQIGALPSPTEAGTS